MARSSFYRRFKLLITAFHLAGSFAAHAIWCLADEASLIPMLAFSEDEDTKMMRLVYDDLGHAVAEGARLLNMNEMNADDAALLYDGQIELPEGKMDALIIEIRSYFSPQSEAVVAIPYTPQLTDNEQLRIHRPQIVSWDNCEDFDIDQSMDAFFEGVYTHEEGAKVWEECFDDSI